MADRNIRAIFIGDASSLLRANKQVETSLSGLGGKVEGFATKYRTQIGLATAAGTAAITGFVTKSVHGAAQLEQSIGGVESVFKENAGTILAWGRTASESAGLSRNAFNELATPLGAMLKNAGYGLDETTDKTIELTQRAADMAATFGGPVDQAVTAISAALRGETDPIERYGVSLRAVDVQARALADTGKTVVGELTPLELQQARIAMLFEQTADAAGQFAREADTVSGQSEILKARFDNLSAELGTKLLPVVSSFLGLMLQVPTPVLAVGAGLVVLGTAVGGVLLVLPMLITGWTTLIGLAPLLGTAITVATGPVGLLAIGIAALITAGVLLVQNWDWVKERGTAAIGALTTFVDSRFAWLALLLGPLGFIVIALKFRDQFVAAFVWIQGKLTPIFSWVGERLDWLGGKLSALKGFLDLIGGAVTDPLGTAGNLIGAGAGLFGFDSGGVVPGPVGSPRLVVAHAGETILPTHKGPVGIGGGNHYSITVNALDPTSAADAVVNALRNLEQQGRIDRVTVRA